MRPVEGVALMIPADLEAEGLLTVLDPVPELVIDDSELRQVDDLALLPVPDAGDALAGPRIFDIGGAVPLDPADIDGVVEEAGAAVELLQAEGIAPVLGLACQQVADTVGQDRSSLWAPAIPWRAPAACWT